MIKKINIKGYKSLRNFIWEPKNGVNIIVGENASGKSTILEAIELAMTQGFHGRRAKDYFSPYWFNSEMVDEYFNAISIEESAAIKPPEILIEIYFEKDSSPSANLEGYNNEEKNSFPGMSLRIKCKEDLNTEFIAQVLEQKSVQEFEANIIPTEFYEFEWKAFSGTNLNQKPRGVACSRIGLLNYSPFGAADPFARNLLDDLLEEDQVREITSKYRVFKQEVDEEVFQDIGQNIFEDIENADLSLQMDKSQRDDWRNSIILDKGGLPLTFAGDGAQVETKALIALKQLDESGVLLIEEPENHLSHTSLTRLLGYISNQLGERQIFVTTHSTYVMNRLGLNRLALMSKGGNLTTITELSSDTVNYFQKLSGYDTLRIVVGEKVLVVEGPSDEMVFCWAYHKIKKRDPKEDGIDIVCFRTQGARILELAAALDRKNILVLRDNDGKEPEYWNEKTDKYCCEGRDIYVSECEKGKTLELQIINANEDNLVVLGELFGCNTDKKELTDYMLNHKTDWAFKILDAHAEQTESLNIPSYINSAIAFFDNDYEK